MYNDDFLQTKLSERRKNNAFRELRLSENKIDFFSNDYLGIVKNNLLNSHESSYLKTGSTGSRLLSGNYALIEETENIIAGFHKAEAVLIFNSGYDANIGVLSSVPQKNDTILFDELSHASIRDGIRLSFANSYSFRHNNMNDLEDKLKRSSGNVFIVTESVFSMDGDICPLVNIIELAEKYKAHVILDEAHATGIIGLQGEGLAQHLQLHNRIFCRVHTFGKACGCYGAAITGSQQLKTYLINFARSFVYTTALPEQTIALIKKTYSVFPGMNNAREHMVALTSNFQSAKIRYEKLYSQTPIQGVLVSGNNNAKGLANELQIKNIDVKAILYPTVPKNKERVRIVLHAFNTMNELTLLTDLL